MTKKSNKKLSAKQEKFCLEYIKSHNATEAAINADYSEKTARIQGSQLLTKLNIKNRIKELSDAVEKQDVADAAEIRKTLTSILREKADEDVVCTVGIGQGESIIKHTRKGASIRDRMKAAELLAKMLGVSEPKDEGENENNGKQVVDKLTDALVDRKVTGIDGDGDGEEDEDDTI